jgi:serine/threonine protein kinase
VVVHVSRKIFLSPVFGFIYVSFIDDYQLDGVVEVLNELLQCDPRKRPTAHQALMHRYFYTKPPKARPGTEE